MFSQTFLILSLISVAASKGSSDCVAGVDLAVGEFSFASQSGEVGSYYEIHCSEPLFIESLWSTARLYCSPEDIIAGEDYLNSNCIPEGFVLPSYASVEANITIDYINSLQVLGYDDIAKVETYNDSIIASKPLLDAAIKTYVVFNESESHYAHFSWTIVGYWGLVLLFGIFCRFVQFMNESRLSQRNADSGSPSAPYPRITPQTSTSLFEKPRHWIRTNLIVPATFDKYHSRLWWGCNLPTRAQLVVLIIYYLLTILLSAVSYEVFSPNLYYTPQEQGWRYVSDRTGALAYANIPLLWLFAGRNNIFIWATGWKFSTFNLFHRHIARVTVILAVVHSVGYSVLTYVDGGTYYYQWTQLYWIMGAVAVICMSFILLFSSVILRRRSYEIFLLSHIVLSVAALVALYYHTQDYGPLAFDPYLWAAVAIWSFDRFVRIVRWVYCNIHVNAKHIVTTKANAIYNEEADIIILKISPGAQHLKPGPSQHYFIYQYNSWRGWENHPFSLASWNENSTPSNFERQTVTIEGTKSEYDTEAPPSPSTASQLSTNDGQELTFYLRPLKGFTGRLRKQCLGQTEPVPLRLLLEGPYGHPFSAHTYDTLILVAGGSGIAGVLPYLRKHDKGSQTTQIRLIWAAKQVSMINEIVRRENIQESDIAVQTSLFVTGHDQALESDGNDHKIQVKGGRPNIMALVSEEVRQTGQQRTAVVACGPPGMADETRACVHALLLEGFKRVEYVEESFGW